jgi:hypothetical protein
MWASLRSDVEPRPRATGRRRWLWVLAIAVVTLVALEVMARLVGSRLPDPLLWPRYEVQRKIDDLRALGADGCLDTVVLGTSVANAALDAGRIEESLGDGARVYNASLGGAGLGAMETWADDVVLPLACPEHVVIGLSPRDLNDNNAENEFPQQYLASLGRADLLDEASLGERIELAALDWSGLVRLRVAFRNPSAAAAWIRDRSGPWRETNDDHGTLTRFRRSGYDASASRRINDREVVFGDYEVGGLRSRELASLVERIKETGASVTIAMLPFTRTETIEMLSDGEQDVAAYEAAVRAVAERTGAELIDVSGLATERVDFADDYHLNGKAAATVSEALAGQL